MNQSDTEALKALVAAIQEDVSLQPTVVNRSFKIADAARAAESALERLLASQGVDEGRVVITIIEWQALWDALAFTAQHAGLVSDAHNRVADKVEAIIAGASASPFAQTPGDADIQKLLRQRIALVKETAVSARGRGHRESAACFEYAASIMTKVLNGTDEILKKALDGGISTFSSQHSPVALDLEAAAEACREEIRFAVQIALETRPEGPIDGWAKYLEHPMKRFEAILRRHTELRGGKP